MNLSGIERVSIALITTLVFGILGFISVQQESEKIKSRNHETARSIGVRAASNLSLPIYNVDTDLAERILKTEFAVEELSSLIVMETDGNLFAGLARGVDGKILDLKVPNLTFTRPDYMQILTYKQAEQVLDLGHIKVYLDPHVGNRQIESYIQQVFFTLATADIALLCLIYMFFNKMAVTTRKAEAAHMAARHSQQQMRAVIESSRDLIAALDPQHRLITFNTAFAAHIKRNYGHDVKQGEDFTSIIQSLSGAESLVQKETWNKALQGESFLNTYAIGAADPSDTTYWEASFSPIIDDEGFLLGAVCLNRHVTESKKDQEELKQRAEDLAKSNSMLENFAFIASHDLKEPLRKMRLQSQILLQEHYKNLNAEGQKYLSNIEDASLRMTQLISSVLSVAMVKQQKVVTETIDITNLLDKIQNSLSSELKQRPFAINYKNMPSIISNEGLISSLFQNLVENAIKYSRAEVARVTISYHPYDAHHHFAISDNGIGISKEYYGKIFEIFQRLHNKTEFPGSGVGLSICKTIVDRLGGKIWVESELGSGSTFHFTLAKTPPKASSNSADRAA